MDSLFIELPWSLFAVVVAGAVGIVERSAAQSTLPRCSAEECSAARAPPLSLVVRPVEEGVAVAVLDLEQPGLVEDSLVGSLVERPVVQQLEPRGLPAKPYWHPEQQHFDPLHPRSDQQRYHFFVRQPLLQTELVDC